MQLAQTSLSCFIFSRASGELNAEPWVGQRGHNLSKLLAELVIEATTDFTKRFERSAIFRLLFADEHHGTHGDVAQDFLHFRGRARDPELLNQPLYTYTCDARTR